MATIQQKIMSIAESQGYEGEGGSTIVEAVNALGSVMGGGGSGGGGMVIHATGGGNTLTTDVTYEDAVAYVNEGNYNAVVIHDSSTQGYNNSVYTLGSFGKTYDQDTGGMVTVLEFYCVSIITSSNKTELFAQVIAMAPSGTTKKTARGTLGS